MTGWSSKPEWPKTTDTPAMEEVAAHGWPMSQDETHTIIYPATPEFPAVQFDVMQTVDLAKQEVLKVTDIKEATEDAKIKLVEVADGMLGQKLSKKYNNKMPTHDPYTNPNAQLYYECKCGAILDPGTKSFAALNNHASDKGWKVRWNSNGSGYEPFCVECGKDVE